MLKKLLGLFSRPADRAQGGEIPLARTRKPVEIHPPVPPVPPREANDDWLRPGSSW